MTKAVIRAHHGLHRLPEKSPFPAILEHRQGERADPTAKSGDVGSKKLLTLDGSRITYPGTNQMLYPTRLSEDVDAGLILCGDTQC